MSDEVLIKVENVGKKFCRDLKRSLWYGVGDIAREITGREKKKSLRPKEFWALDDISFELKRGEVLGLIGRNGAGKTTLLKILNNLIKPDTGRVTVRGRVGALIALGAGFNPVLTGRENIYVNGSVLGLKKREIDAKYDEIVDFAEIWDFIDTPVQSYSSGMKVRLGFAVATALNPDVLLLDEVLAVGDAAFRNKCYNRMGELKKSASIIFVSHSMEQVSMISTKGLLLNTGCVQYYGDLSPAISCYESIDSESQEIEDSSFENICYPVTKVKLIFDTQAQHCSYLPFKMIIDTEEDVNNAVLRVVLYNSRQVPCAEWNNKRNGKILNLVKGRNTIKLTIGPLVLKKGKYRLGINLNDFSGVKMLLWSYKKNYLDIEDATSLGPDVAFDSDIINIHEDN